ncbi:hypothetical protein Leryth_020802 [Lithospermum erythrorhizon]|nr:hypothetical protein Leryth_020802 [Lithospermum erythrorhizon]
MGDQRLTRIAIVSADKCKPKKCRQECKKSCPVVKTGKLCIEVTVASKIAFISEELCIGCGICVKKCPFEAIQIINLPKDLEKDTTHRYGPNTFKLHRLPVPRPGQVLGLVGTNGIGKSTALKVLAGKLKPNLGRFNNPPDWQEILTHFRGPIWWRAQRFAIAVVAIQNAEIYMFDEPSSYLDVRQRLKAARKCYPIFARQVVEHDLSVLDYLSDFICCLYGKPGAYGVVTLPFSVREGINIFLAGFVPTENLRFRDESLTFKVSERRLSAERLDICSLQISNHVQDTGKFQAQGYGRWNLMDSQIIVMLGGELQRVALTLCLGKVNFTLKMDHLFKLTYGVEIYLMSVYLLTSITLTCPNEVRAYPCQENCTVVEHDFIMATYLADRVIVYEGQPSVDCVANAPQSLLTGMNLFLSQLDITFRRDPTNFRPRINKLESTKDREQKNAGSSFKNVSYKRSYYVEHMLIGSKGEAMAYAATLYMFVNSILL